MDENIPKDNDNVVSDIIGTTTYEAQARTEKKKLKPWHKPRKQFVRDKQWCNEIRELVNEVDFTNNTLKYLGLPGDDLLDLRYFHDQICKPNELKLKFLGFNNSKEAKTAATIELNISKHEISKLEFISAESEIIPDDICQIATDSSIANQRSKKMGPFDVINIDLCDGFAKLPHDDENFAENHYNTLHKLMIFQHHRKDPWLLFITTRCGLEHINTSVLNLLKDLFGKNLNSCAPFQEASMMDYNVNTLETLDQLVGSNKGASDVFLIALCKWIASLGLAMNPIVTVEVKSAYGYKVRPCAEHLDLTSICLKITPTDFAKQDSFGLASAVDANINECEAAVQALKTIYYQKDVDAMLDNDFELKTQMVKATGNLLGLARYDVEEYYASDFAK